MRKEEVAIMKVTTNFIQSRNLAPINGQSRRARAEQETGAPSAEDCKKIVPKLMDRPHFVELLLV